MEAVEDTDQIPESVPQSKDESAVVNADDKNVAKPSDAKTESPLPLGKNVGAKTAVHDEEEERTIQRILRFWNHPSLQSMSPDAKKDYLKQRGVSDAQIFQAFDRLVESTPDKQQSQLMTPPAMSPPLYNNGQLSSAHQYHPPEEEEDDGLVATAAAVAAVGGFLGLAAAAVYRWLNGGDFVLLPPPSRAKESVEQGARVLTLQDGISPSSFDNGAQVLDHVDDEVVEDEDFDEEDDYVDDEDYHPSQDVLLMQQAVEHFRSLSDTMQNQLQTQQRFIQKLDTKSYTNRSMDLLRNPQESTTATKTSESANLQLLMQVWSKLVEIQAELTMIRRDLPVKPEQNGNRYDLESKISTLLAQLESTMDDLKSSFDKPKERATKGAADKKVTLEETKADLSGDVALKGNLSSKTTATVASPVSTAASEPLKEISSLGQALSVLTKENSSEALIEGSRILYLYVSNLSKHMFVPRYQKIFMSNESFKKVANLKGGKELLLAIGFTESGSYLQWKPPTPDDNDPMKDQVDDETVQLLKDAVHALDMIKNGQSTTADKTEARLPSAVGATPSPQQGQVLMKTPEPSILSPPLPRKDPNLSPLLSSNLTYQAVASPERSLAPTEKQGAEMSKTSEASQNSNQK